MKPCKHCQKPIPLNVVMCDKCGDAEAEKNLEAFVGQVRAACTPSAMQRAVEHMRTRHLSAVLHRMN